MPPRKSTKGKAAAGAPTPAKKGKRARSPDATPSADANAEKASASSTQKPAKRARSVSKEAADLATKHDATESAKKATEPAPSRESSPDYLETRDERLSGNSDLYGMDLSFLSNIYLPDDSETPQHEALYKKILEYQAKKDRTAQVFLPDPLTSYLSGLFGSGALRDPMSEERLEIEADPIHTDSLTFSDSEREPFLTPVSNGPGVIAKFALAEDNCGIDSVSGSLKLKQVPVWMKESDDGGRPLELFEGHVTFKVSYGSIYRRKGHGSGFSIAAAVWAVRARKDSDGNEIGLEEF